MKTPHTFEIVPNNGNSALYLAPFGEKELGQVTPLRADQISYETTYIIDLYSDPEAPQKIWKEIEGTNRGDVWGIYKGNVTPTCFVGMIQLAEALYAEGGVPRRDETLVEVGTTLFAPHERGQGIGTLAKLAVMQYAFQERGAHVIEASTSERNTIAQRSLWKAGLWHLGNDYHFEFTDGEATQQWQLAHPSHPLIPWQQNAQQAGWRRHVAALQAISIRKID